VQDSEGAPSIYTELVRSVQYRNAGKAGIARFDANPVVGADSGRGSNDSVAGRGFESTLRDNSARVGEDQKYLVPPTSSTGVSGSSVALIGDRGIGKSSLLKANERISLERLARQAIYVDWHLGMRNILGNYLQ
jgi:hypothetical protein